MILIPFFSNFYRPFLPVFRQLLNMVLIYSSIFTTSNHVSGTIICFVSICLSFFNNQKTKQSSVLIVDIFIKTVPQPPQNLIAIKLMLYSPQHQFEKCRKQITLLMTSTLKEERIFLYRLL